MRQRVAGSRKRARLVVGASMLLASLLGPASARAGTLTLDLDVVFSGQAPAGAAPWLRATFDDQDGFVRLTLEALNLTGSEFVTEWDFNFNPALDPANLLIQHVSGAVPRSIRTEADGFKADGQGFFDIEFRFQSKRAERFSVGDMAVFDISFKNGNLLGLPDLALTASDFDFESVGKKGIFRSAAKVQAIGPNDDSGWLGANGQQVPAPSPLLLLGAGLLVLAFARRQL